MRYALVDAGGKVVDVVEWDGIAAWTPPAGTTAVQSDTAGTEWTYSDGAFTAPPLPPSTPPPLTATALQARRVLRAAGLYDAVKDAVFASPNPDTVDTWEYETVWKRDGAWIDEIAPQIGLTPEQVDALFVQASTF
jgi:hypothetical protein